MLQSKGFMGCHSEPERSEDEKSSVRTTARFCVADFILSEVEGLRRMTTLSNHMIKGANVLHFG